MHPQKRVHMLRVYLLLLYEYAVPVTLTVPVRTASSRNRHFNMIDTCVILIFTFMDALIFIDCDLEYYIIFIHDSWSD